MTKNSTSIFITQTTLPSFPTDDMGIKGPCSCPPEGFGPALPLAVALLSTGSGAGGVIPPSFLFQFHSVQAQPLLHSINSGGARMLPACTPVACHARHCRGRDGECPPEPEGSQPCRDHHVPSLRWAHLRAAPRSFVACPTALTLLSPPGRSLASPPSLGGLPGLPSAPQSLPPLCPAEPLSATAPLSWDPLQRLRLHPNKQTGLQTYYTCAPQQVTCSISPL